MKKHSIIFQKKGEISVPVYPEPFQAMLHDVKDGDYFQGIFGNVTKPKSNEQLGWLYSAIYPHFIAYYKETQGYIFQIQKGSELIDVEPNKISVDLYFKTLFCVSKTIKEFSKEKASTGELKEYIDFLDKHSIDRFDCPLPPPKKGDQDERT